MTETEKKTATPPAQPIKKHDQLSKRIETALEAGEKKQKTVTGAVEAYRTGTEQLLAYIQTGRIIANPSPEIKKVYDAIVLATQPLGTEGGLAARVQKNVSDLQESRQDYNDACEALEELATRVETYMQK